MRATFDTAPAGALQPYLEAVAEGLVLLNMVWIAEQLRRGGDPPCCTACAEPPWTAGLGVDYIPFHGDKAKAAARRYIDGATMFAEGRGTCMDIACYDVAALRVKKSTHARVWTPPIDGDGEYHALVVMPDGEVKDPALEVQQRGTLNVGAVRRSGLVVRRFNSIANVGSTVRRRQLAADIRGSSASSSGSTYGSTSVRSSCRSCGGG